MKRRLLARDEDCASYHDDVLDDHGPYAHHGGYPYYADPYAGDENVSYVLHACRRDGDGDGVVCYRGCLRREQRRPQEEREEGERSS